MPRIIDNFRDRAPVWYKEHQYKTSEHAFHAQKAENEKDRQYVADAATPAEAKQRGRQIVCRAGWDDIRVDEMGMIVYFKYTQNDDIRLKLVQTGDAILIEGNWWRDDFWGMVKDGQGNWVGENYLGRLTMSVRNVFMK